MKQRTDKKARWQGREKGMAQERRHGKRDVGTGRCEKVREKKRRGDAPSEGKRRD